MTDSDTPRSRKAIEVVMRSESGTPPRAWSPTAVAQYLAIAKDGVLALAVLVGGIWALIRYDLIESNAAKARYELDLQKLKAQVQMTAQADQRVVRDGNRVIIIGHLTLKNIGSRDVVVQCDASPPVTLYRLDTTQVAPMPIVGSKVEAYFLAEDGTRQDYASIDIGNTVTLPFTVVAPAPGFYLLNVAVPVSRGDLSQQEIEAGEGWSWSDQHILDLR